MKGIQLPQVHDETSERPVCMAKEFGQISIHSELTLLTNAFLHDPAEQLQEHEEKRNKNA